ncbi:glycosyltransferase family 2 protein [Paenibacillus sp. IB182496]|uniref:Glycosyltransferase family 2 protein n=2 Tax=Paenibacillus sabuli TaxID=2772509 RepID=A0A927BUT2_9BACL|nr:glycosyltransferase family 2 protein [Paenibacillus sabuli]
MLVPTPTVSVIIPTYNAGPRFGELLTRLQRQTHAPQEIIVVDSTSRDDTAAIARRAGAIVLELPQAEFDHGGTRNMAAARAEGDVLLFMTQDAMPADEHLIAHLIAPLVEADVACAYARQLPYADADPLERMARAFNYPAQPQRKRADDLPRLGLKTFFCSNVCAAVRRHRFHALGGFAAPVIFNEDLFLAATAVLDGYAIHYAAEAQVYHSHGYTLTQHFRRFFDNGVSMRSNAWIYPYAKVGKEGGRLVRAQLQQLRRERRWHWMPRLIGESAAKWLGYQLGKRYTRLPRAWCARMSMHRRIWDKLQRQPARAEPGGVSMRE